MLRVSNLIKSTLEGNNPKGLDYSILIWNLTNRCNLSCLHCYSKASVDSKGALTTDEIVNTLPSLINAGIKFIIFSGGEPLLRKDIFEIAQECKKQGIITYLSTNGMYINESNVKNIVENFNYIGVSIDGESNIHDSFRGIHGAFERSFGNILKLLKYTDKVGVRFTLTKSTLKSLKFMFNLVERNKIPKIYISHLVYSGRGLENLKMDISKRQRRSAVNFIIEKALFYYRTKRNIEVVTGNMEQDAILLLKRFIKEYPDHTEDLYTRLEKWGGNSAGIKLANIDSFGNVKPDPFFPYILGNIKEKKFEEIWRDEKNPILNFLRHHPRNIDGRCKDCYFINICNGGSRSRAYAVYRDIKMEDPSCYLLKDEIRGKL
jgi:radical SAM protein with 4Fe4S-binding SPASM domain